MTGIKTRFYLCVNVTFWDCTGYLAVHQRNEMCIKDAKMPFVRSLVHLQL